MKGREKFQLTENSSYSGWIFLIIHFDNMTYVSDNINFHWKVTMLEIIGMNILRIKSFLPVWLTHKTAKFQTVWYHYKLLWIKNQRGLWHPATRNDMTCFKTKTWLTLKWASDLHTAAYFINSHKPKVSLKRRTLL